MAIEDTRYTEADIIALKKAMKSGAKSVTGSDGKAVTFNSLAEMSALLARMEREVYGTARRPSIRTQSIEIRSEGS